MGNRSADREALITENIPLVGFLASTWAKKVYNFPLEEFVSVGAVALVKAADAYNPDLGVPFSAYAGRRIKGAFQDEMRASDWASRGVRRTIVMVQDARQTLETALGRDVTPGELAEATGLSTDEVASALADESRVVLGSETLESETIHIPSSEMCPDEAAEAAEERELLLKAIASLPDRLRYIITQTAFEGRTISDVAVELGVTRPAVSMQRSEALRMLRAVLVRVLPEREAMSQGPTPVLSQRALAGMDQRLAEQSSRFSPSFA